MSKSSVQLTERATISSIASALEADAIIELYELDFSSVPSLGISDVLRFHAGVTDQDSEISWQGNIYNAFPIEARGFDMTGKGQIPRPSLQVANITTTSTGQGWGSISSLTRDYDDLVGIQVVRKRTFARFLDNYCSINGHSHSGRCSDDSWNNSKYDCCIQGSGSWDGDDATCSGSSLIWTEYDCTTCSAAHCSDASYTTEADCASAGKTWRTEGVWNINNKSKWVSVDNTSWELEKGQNHSHSVSLSPSELCSLGMGNKITKTSDTNTYVLPEIEVTSVDGSGGITGFNTVNQGANFPDSITGAELFSPWHPDIGTGFDSVVPTPHTHFTEGPTIAELATLIDGQVSSITIESTENEGHTHSIVVTYDPSTFKILFTFNTSDNHSTGTPHTTVYNSNVQATFSAPSIVEGSLGDFSIISAGEGYQVDDVILLKDIPTWVSHSHDVELEYKYQGTDSKILVTGTDSNFKGATTSWASQGADLTTNYDSSDSGYANCLRIESNGIRDGGFTDVDTFKDSEYLLSFNYKIVTGSDCKVVVESLNNDLSTWTSEFEEALTGSGWQTYSKVFYTKDIDRSPKTRITVFAAADVGGSDDEILLDTFLLNQTWVRGDTVARSITSNTSDQHLLEYKHNLVINTADPTAFMEDDIYFIDRKATENNIIIEFELAPAWDVEGIKLPSREIIQNTCLWKYKGSECGYTGTNYYNYNDQASTSDNDMCGKRLNSCELRFGSTAVLPYGGFPGAGLGIRK